MRLPANFKSRSQSCWAEGPASQYWNKVAKHMLNQRPSQPFYPNDQPFLAKISQLMISSQHVTVSSQETIISKCMKPINNSKQPTSNSLCFTFLCETLLYQKETILFFLYKFSDQLCQCIPIFSKYEILKQQIGQKNFTANFTKKNLAASQKIFFLPLGWVVNCDYIA